MVGIIAPMKATVSMVGKDGKTKSKTLMIEGKTPVATVDSILDAVKVTAGIVDSFAKGWHPKDVTENDSGDIVISAEKDEMD